MILHSQFKLAQLCDVLQDFINLINVDVDVDVHFSFEDKGNLLFKIRIKLIEMFELHERMPGMRSAEYQAAIPLKFFTIIHNYANV